MNSKQINNGITPVEFEKLILEYLEFINAVPVDYHAFGSSFVPIESDKLITKPDQTKFMYSGGFGISFDWLLDIPYNPGGDSFSLRLYEWNTDCTLVSIEFDLNSYYIEELGTTYAISGLYASEDEFQPIERFNEIHKIIGNFVNSVINFFSSKISLKTM